LQHKYENASKERRSLSPVLVDGVNSSKKRLDDWSLQERVLLALFTVRKAI
jgi:hypothetical protein